VFNFVFVFFSFYHSNVTFCLAAFQLLVAAVHLFNKLYKYYSRTRVNARESASRVGETASSGEHHTGSSLLNKSALAALKPARQATNGSRVEQIILPGDPIALLDRLHLLLASHRAGNIGARNERVAICDELRRRELLMIQDVII
jgi:hypothetical protein